MKGIKIAPFNGAIIYSQNLIRNKIYPDKALVGMHLIKMINFYTMVKLVLDVVQVMVKDGHTKYLNLKTRKSASFSFSRK